MNRALPIQHGHMRALTLTRLGFTAPVLVVTSSLFSMLLTAALLIRSSSRLCSSPLVRVVTFLTIFVVIRLFPSSPHLLVFVDSKELPKTSVDRRFFVYTALRLSTSPAPVKLVTIGGPRALESELVPWTKSLLEAPGWELSLTKRYIAV